MSDGYRDVHMRMHWKAHDAGKACPECGQRPDGTYPRSMWSKEKRIEDLEKRMETLEREVQYLNTRHGDW